MRVVGIDAGGTKTEFLLCDENENVINRVLLGTGNPNDIGIDACLALLGKGLRKLCGNVVPDAVFAGVSGGGYGENCERIRTFLRELYPTSLIDNGTDAINLLYCAKTDKTCAALICGTGSALFVKKGDDVFRIGGWGHLFDVGGSAYDVARDAIRVLLELEESTIKGSLDTPLCRLLTARLGCSAHKALNDFYSKGKPYIASFAPVVFEAFDMGDEVALSIIESNARAVASRLLLARSSYGDIDCVVCTGGLFSNRIFFNMLSEKIDMPLLIPDVSPAVGACRRALELVG